MGHHTTAEKVGAILRLRFSVGVMRDMSRNHKNRLIGGSLTSFKESARFVGTGSI